MLSIKIMFYFGAFLIIYTYMGYLLLLMLMSKFVKQSSSQESMVDEPKVSLIISVYNEENVIESKLENTIALNYKRNRLEIVVVSDGSTDKTNDIVRKYKDENVVLRHYGGRIGKTACLNQAVPHTTGDIIVFSDANSKYDKNAIKEIVKPFVSDDIGFVTGSTKYISKSKDAVTESVGIYSKLEKLTKMFESKIGSCVGADGAIFAIRKKLFKTLRASDINDLVIPLNIIKHGYRGVLADNAFCIEDTAGTTKGEFARQVRITTRTIRAIFNTIELINPLKYGLFSFELFSHKVLKLLVPIFLLIVFITNLLLVSQGTVFIVLLAAQLSFYLMAYISCRGLGGPFHFSIMSATCTFTTVNLAIFWGWVKFFQGESFTTWQPVNR